jgi:hypothetical protein
MSAIEGAAVPLMTGPTEVCFNAHLKSIGSGGHPPQSREVLGILKCTPKFIGISPVMTSSVGRTRMSPLVFFTPRWIPSMENS